MENFGTNQTSDLVTVSFVVKDHFRKGTTKLFHGQK